MLQEIEGGPVEALAKIKPARKTKAVEADWRVQPAVAVRKSPEGTDEMVGTCPAMLRVFQLIRKVAYTDFPILVTGASGTGKEMVAKAIHQRSQRASGPFVVVDCGAIPRELLESELFGHERGSFTGAFRTVAGKVELAHGGTLFLDEVGELPLELQAKLLRFLQDYSFERIGGRERKAVDLRVISATNAHLKKMVAEGRFREDLYYRLNGITIEMPPLKERGDDVLIMANLFLTRCASDLGKDVQGFSREAQKTILTYPWPGNVRELINHVRRAVVLAEGPWVSSQNLGLEEPLLKTGDSNGLGLKGALAEFESSLVSKALAQCGGSVQLAAKLLKTSRSVIYHLIHKHRLEKSVKNSD